MDKQLEFSWEQEETTQATHVSTNDIDLSVHGDAHKPLYFEVKVIEAFTTGTSATGQFKLITDSDSAFGSAVTLYDSGALAVSVLVAGWKFRMPLPIGTVERYLRVQFIIGTGTMTAGSFSAYLVEEVQTNKDTF